MWLGREGQELIEHYNVRGMAHGTPLMPGTGEGESGEARPHMLDVGLSSTDRIAAFFGIGPKRRLVNRKALPPLSRSRRAASDNKPRCAPAHLPRYVRLALPHARDCNLEDD